MACLQPLTSRSVLRGRLIREHNKSGGGAPGVWRGHPGAPSPFVANCIFLFSSCCGAVIGAIAFEEGEEEEEEEEEE